MTLNNLVRAQNSHELLTSWRRIFNNLNKRVITQFIARHLRKHSRTFAMSSTVNAPVHTKSLFSVLWQHANWSESIKKSTTLHAATTRKTFFFRTGTLVTQAKFAITHLPTTCVPTALNPSPWNVNPCSYSLVETRKMFIFLDWNAKKKKCVKIICLRWQFFFSS